MRSCNVRVTVDGKAKKPASVDRTGIATSEAGKLRVGRHVIRVEVLGANPLVVDERTITIKTARRPTNGIEWVFSLILLFVVLKYGYTAMTVVGLIGTIGVLLVASIMDDEDTLETFWKKISNNDWVYYMMRAITILSFVLWLTSLESLNPLKMVFSAKRHLVDPYANDGWRYFLIGKAGWGSVALSFLRWTFLAYPISFWDNWFASRKANATKATKTGGIAKWFLHVFVGEGVGEAMWGALGRKK